MYPVQYQAHEKAQFERVQQLMPILDGRVKSLNETLERAATQGVEDWELDLAVGDVRAVIEQMAPLDPDYLEWLEERVDC